MQYGNDLFIGHSGSLQDLSWAPLHGRSFHLLVSAATDHQIIVWKLMVRDIFDSPGVIFDKPQVEKLHSIKLPQMILRVKWNICGTCFAASGDDGSVTLWKREHK